MKNKEAGITSVMIGGILCAYSLFFMDVSVGADTGGMLDSFYKANPNLMQDRFANNDMLNRRLCYLIVACTFCIAGTILVAIPTVKDESAAGNKLLLSQLNLLGSVASKLEVPVSEINEIMEPYGVEFE